MDWFKRLFQPKLKATALAPPGRPRPPLREFVYLDETSLRSLLSSQIGEVTDTTSRAISDGTLNEASGGIGLKAPVNVQMNTRFQTTNSNTRQTSSKASVQSWFRELLQQPGLRLVKPIAEVSPAQTMEALRAVLDKSILISATDLTRGSLVEFSVRLKADPVYHLGTVVSEFAGMVEDHPDLMTSNLSLDTFKEGLMVNKILQRLLVGLVPVRGEVIDYRVVEIEGAEHVVHVKALEGLEIETRPLEIVGVTDQFAYWKDIRRVLFSEAEFTVLCRVSRGGLQRTWTPVKLADLFAALTPGLVDQLNEAALSPLLPKPRVRATDARELRLGVALQLYASAMVSAAGTTLTDEQNARIEQRIYETSDRSWSASAQRSAFTAVADELRQVADIRVDPDIDLSLRERARILSGLPLFPSLEPKEAADSAPQLLSEGSVTRLLDVEVVAIYW